jgi:acetolactate synthase I/II/III large subunit
LKIATSETVAEAIAAELSAAGVDRVFGLPGGEVLILIDALRRGGIEFVLCRHEADAGLMAAVYGKLRGTPGVVLTTLGPGASNLLLPVSNSLLDREPLVAISAQVPSSWPASRIHQRLPLLEVFRPVTKFAAAVNPFNCRQATRQALRDALAEPAGPSYLTISSDVTWAASLSSRSSAGAPVEEPEAGDPAAAAAILRERLAAAERPLLAVGVGAHPEDAALVRRWIQEWRLPVTVTPKIKGMVDETDPLFGGVIGGMAIDSVMVEGLSQADLVVGLGLDPTEIDGGWHDTLPMVWIQDSAWATGVTPESGLIACPQAALLEELLKQPAPRSWEDPFRSARNERRRVYEERRERPGHLLPVAAVRALAAALPADTIVTTDVGSHKYLFGQFWPSRRPATFFMSNGLSGMGYGLPAAIGAKLARPDQPVLAALGDGGFSMNSQELETARRVGAPVLVAVLADRSYSMIRVGQRKRGLEPYGVDFDPIDSVLAARSCGVRGCRVGSEAELTASAREALESGETTVIEIPIQADDYAGIV